MAGDGEVECHCARREERGQCPPFEWALITGVLLGVGRTSRGWREGGQRLEKEALHHINVRHDCMSADPDAPADPDVPAQEFRPKKSDKIDYLLSFLRKILILIEKQLQDQIF